MFIAALFTMVKTWKQRKCPLTKEWIKKMWYITHNGILLRHYKEWNKAICNNMDGPRECHTEWSKSDRDGEISYDIPYMWNLKRNNTNELTKQKEMQRLRKWTYDCQGEGIVREFGKTMYTAIFKMDNLLQRTGNSAQCYVTTWMRGGFGGEWIHVFVCLSPIAVHPKLPQDC